MKRSLFLLLIPFTAFSQDNNLDFEKLGSNGKQPADWGVPVPQGNHYGYTVLSDSIAYSGKYSVVIEKRDTARKGGFGSLEMSVPAEFKGKRVRLEGYVRTEDIKGGWAGLYMRVDGTREFDNMEKRGITGTTDWQKYSVELALSDDADKIAIGALLVGDGKMWIDRLSLSVDGKDLADVPRFIKGIPAPEQLAWLKQHAMPLKAVDAENGSGDLEGLKTLVGDARIVSLGEPTHGTSEAFRMKHRLLEFLVKEMGFNLFSIEANMPECNAINQFVLNGAGDPKKLLDTMYFWTWNTQEVLDMITWMRTYNIAHPQRPVQFTGFDMQFAAGAVQGLEDFMAAYAPSQNVLADSIGAQSRRLQRQKRSNTAGEMAKALNTSLSDMKQYLEANRQTLTAAAGQEKYGWALQYITVLSQFAVLDATGMNRDRSMADNVAWLAQQYPGSKLVLWAHNGHVAKGKARMGGHLDKTFGRQMKVIGFSAGEGTYTAVESGKGLFSGHPLSAPEPGTFELYARNSGLGNFILDVRREKLQDPHAAWLLKKIRLRMIGSMAMLPKYQFAASILPDEYDAIIYLDKTRASDCFQAAKKES